MMCFCTASSSCSLRTRAAGSRRPTAWEGWTYVATVIDLSSRPVVGLASADHLRASLVCEALEMALAQRRPAKGLVFHSDRGSQGHLG